MNTVNLIGFIATEIDLSYTPAGDAVARFNLAVKRPFSKDKTDFIPIETWKRSAENTAEFCSKGSKVAIAEGTFMIDEWEKDGQKRSKAKVNAGQVIFLDSKSKGDKPQQNSNKSDDPFDGTPVDTNMDSLPF